jgi:hypothetical protein
LKNPLTNPSKCDIIKAQKRERQQNQAPKKIKKNSKKGLTNARKCDIIKAQKGKKSPLNKSKRTTLLKTRKGLIL